MKHVETEQMLARENVTQPDIKLCHIKRNTMWELQNLLYVRVYASNVTNKTNSKTLTVQLFERSGVHTRLCKRKPMNTQICSKDTCVTFYELSAFAFVCLSVCVPI
jgi:hypothetical protein